MVIMITQGMVNISMGVSRMAYFSTKKSGAVLMWIHRYQGLTLRYTYINSESEIRSEKSQQMINFWH